MILRFSALLTAVFVFTCFLVIGQELPAPPHLPSSTPAPVSSRSDSTKARDFTKTVFPITELSVPSPNLSNLKRFHGVGLEVKYGTGFCLDPACRFIATNYHVAAAFGQPRKIKGERVVQCYLGTGPDDDGATVNTPPGLLPMKYAVNRDLAICELRRPLQNHRGLGFNADELRPGQPVTIYSYPKRSVNPSRKLVESHAGFIAEDTDGLLAFKYDPSGNEIRPGASGGIVVDDETGTIVGVLNGIGKNVDEVALAVPIDSLSEFVHKVEPYLAQRLFPSGKVVPPVTADLYPKFVPPAVDGLRHRSNESPTIKSLRKSAQSLSDGMRDFIANQSLQWGRGNSEPSALAAYEIRVIDGIQRFRELPDGKEELDEIPFPALNNVINTGSEWSELARMVGTELGLKINQAPDSVIGDKRIHVFQYTGALEDGVCPWRSVLDLVFFKIDKRSNVACYGEVWTDDETNIIRISLHQEVQGTWRNPDIQVTYGWLNQGETPRLIPLTIAVQAELHKKLYWCRGQFTNYRTFKSRVKILRDQPAPLSTAIK